MKDESNVSIPIEKNRTRWKLKMIASSYLTCLKKFYFTDFYKLQSTHPLFRINNKLFYKTQQICILCTEFRISLTMDAAQSYDIL